MKADSKRDTCPDMDVICQSATPIKHMPMYIFGICGNLGFLKEFFTLAIRYLSFDIEPFFLSDFVI